MNRGKGVVQHRLLRLMLSSLQAVVLFVSVGHAQVDRAGMNGTVTDSLGRVLPGVHVTAVQDSTGLRRDTVSSVSGTYALPELPVGIYHVIFDRDGFQQLHISSVEQSVGHTRTLDASLNVAGPQESVDVEGAAPELNETSASMGGRLERKQIQELPMNGRNWATLTALTPGAIDAGGSNQRAVRFAGRGLDDNNFTFDGIDATNIVNQAQQPFVRLAVPTDAIQEFRVEAMLFAAESGSTPGGQVAITSATGNNQFHGSAFEFLRNDVFDARNPFDHSEQKPPFHLSQFGVGAGGPIIRGKSFFYLSYEGIRQNLGQFLEGFVPTIGLRNQVLAQSPALASIINAYPLGQTQMNSQVAQFIGSGRQLDHENSVMLRLDQRFTDHSTAFVRFSMDEAVSEVPLGSSGQFLSDRQQISSRPVNGVIEFLRISSPALVNEAKFGFNRGTVLAANLSQNGLPFSIAVPGLTTQNNNQTRIGIGNSFSAIDNVTWVKGRHVVKAGAEVRRIELNQGNTSSGSISFTTLSGFVIDKINSSSFAAALPVNGLRKTAIYAFVQDEFKWKPNLTLNLGLRYEFFNRFHEVLGRAIPFDLSTCGPQGFCPAGSEFSRPNVADLDPRIAVVWAPANLGGKTVIRSGFGIYHGDGQLDDQNLPISNEVRRFSLSQASIPGLSFPIAPFLAGLPGTISARDMDRRRKDMYVSSGAFPYRARCPRISSEHFPTSAARELIS